MKKTEKIKELVKNDYCDVIEWKYHLESVHKFAMALTKKIKCDAEVVELAALLHDIGRYVTKEQKDHELTGLPEAEKILKKHNYSQEKIAKILHCIKAHRGSVDVETKTIEAEIVKNADAMAHYDILPLFFVACGYDDKNITQQAIKTKEKFERNWNKKLTLKEAKEEILDKHNAAMLILDSLLDL